MMAVPIVDVLEVIDIAHHQREGAPEPDRSRDFPREFAIEEPPAAAACELVDRRQNPVVVQGELQRCRETDDAPHRREMRPELFSAGLTGCTVISAGPQGTSKSHPPPSADEHDVSGGASVKLSGAADRRKVVGEQHRMDPPLKLSQRIPGSLG